MPEPIVSSLAAIGIARGAPIVVEKARETIRREPFADTLEPVAEEFVGALQNNVQQTLENHGHYEFADVRADWVTISEALSSLEPAFETETEAVATIMDAMQEGIELDLDGHPELRSKLEAAIAESYETMLDEFAEQLADKGLAKEFNARLGIELKTEIANCQDYLTDIQLRFRRRELAVLRNAGVEWLDPLYFERVKDPVDPEVAWRTGFGFAEIDAGYPLPRERPASQESEERQRLTAEVLDRIDNGEDLVVLGEGGSGKSTLCQQVAYAWHEDVDRGPVLYRRSDTATLFDKPGEVIEAAETTDVHVLIVVEDAAREANAPIYDVLTEFENTRNVSFLLESRLTAWHDQDHIAGDAKLDRQRQRLNVVDIPMLDERECERAVGHYENLTSEVVSVPGSQIYEEVSTADIGGLLVLAYRLTGPGGNGSIQGEETISALHADVRDAYIEVTERANEELEKRVAMMVNVLNVAGLPVVEAFVHALAEDRTDHRTIDQTLKFLEGTMLDRSAEMIRTPHQLWSSMYLDTMLERDGNRVARERLERCVGALFRLVDEEAQRDNVRGWLRESPDALAAIEDETSGVAARFVHGVASVGEERRSLGKLLGTVETWRVELPEVCPTKARLAWYNRRGATHLQRGALDDAESEWKQIVTLSKSADFAETEDIDRWRAIALGNLGLVSLKRGELEAAKQKFEKSHSILRDMGDQGGQAQALLNLGLVALQRGGLKDAKQYYKNSLSIYQGMGNRFGQARCLGNLGLVARKMGNLDVAEEYHKQSLTIEQDLGDRHGQGQSLNNLGLVTHKREEFDRAKEFYKEALTIFQELGDRHEWARSLGNLGRTAKEQDKLDASEEYLDESLNIMRKIGDRHGQAQITGNLGTVAWKRGELKTAKQKFEQAVRLSLDVGAIPSAFIDIGNIVNVCVEQGATDEAIEWCERGIEIAEQVDNEDQRRWFQNHRRDLID